MINISDKGTLVSACPKVIFMLCGAMIQTNPQYLVLLVNDYDIIRDVVEEMLKDLGYKVVLMKDGSEVLSIFNDGDGIQIVVTDILMPEMDGWELAHRIKAIKPTIPFITQTGVGPDEVSTIQLEKYRSCAI